MYRVDIHGQIICESLDDAIALQSRIAMKSTTTAASTNGSPADTSAIGAATAAGEIKATAPIQSAPVSLGQPTGEEIPTAQPRTPSRTPRQRRPKESAPQPLAGNGELFATGHREPVVQPADADIPGFVGALVDLPFEILAALVGAPEGLTTDDLAGNLGIEPRRMGPTLRSINSTAERHNIEGEIILSQRGKINGKLQSHYRVAPELLDSLRAEMQHAMPREQEYEDAPAMA